MNIETVCKKCGPTVGYLSYGDIHIGLHCKKCNSWIKWVSKTDLNILENGNTKLVEDINLIDEIDIKNLEKQRDELDKQINNYYKKQTEKEIANNSGYIGKTFKKPITNEIMGYYKILNVEEDNQYRMKTLVFSLPLKPIASKNMYEETSLIDIESIGWFCNSMTNYGQHTREIDLYVEISNKEYEEAFNAWLEKIKEVVYNDI